MKPNVANDVSLPTLAAAVAASLDADHNVPRAMWERALVGPAVEFVSRPGKEFRGKLTKVGFDLAGSGEQMPESLPLVIEALHAGSLIIDDIEDSADTRRGRPALHLMTGTPIALNTGNWLYFWALQQLGELPISQRLADRLTSVAVRALEDCHRGQALDLSTDIRVTPREHVLAVVTTTTRLKTGALMGLAAELGALTAGADPLLVDSARRLGVSIGVGLQMLDDIGSVCTPARREKAREDFRSGAPTWVWAHAASTVDDIGFARLQHAARSAMKDDAYEELFEEFAARVEVNGRALAHDVLQGGVDALRGGNAPTEVIEEVDRTLTFLEESYG